MDFSAFLAFDKAVFEWVGQIFNYGISSVISPVMTFITHLGDDGIIWIALALVLMIFKKTRKVGFAMAGALVCMTVCNNFILKNLFARPRPFNLEEWQNWFVFPELVSRPSSYSFPSGHTSSAFAAATALASSKKAKIAVPAFLFAALMGFTRIYVHVHYCTDVLFGALLGVVYGLIAIVICKYIIKLINDKTKLNIFR